MMHRMKHSSSKSLVESGGGGILMIKNGLSVLKSSQSGFVPSLGRRRLVVSDVGGASGGGVSSSGFSSTPLGSRRFFNTGGRITTKSSSSSLVKREDMFRTGNIPNLFRGRQTGGCVCSFIPHQCSKSHLLPYFARALASSSALQSSGQTPRQEPEKKKECQIKRSSDLQRERCDEISSTKVSLNQFPRLMVHGNVEDSKTRRLLRLNPDNGYFEEEQGVSAAAANHHGPYELQVPHGHVCRGSAYGWLFLTDDNFDLKLLNPFSGAEIQLPPVKTLPLSSEDEEESDLPKWYVSKAFFSANPSIEPRPVVLVILGLGNETNLAFCKPGDKGWTPLEFPKDSQPMDVIYQKDQFYVLGYPGRVVAFDIGRRIDDDDHSVKTVNVASYPENDNTVYYRDWYFVVLDGEFFRFELRQECFRDCCIDESMQRLEYERERDGDTSDEEDYNEREMDDGDTRYEESSDDGDGIKDGKKESSDDDDGIKDGKKESDDEEYEYGEYPCLKLRLPMHVYGIKIRRFDASEKQWVKVESLGGKAVFLGYNTSFALSASDYPAGVCIPDSVYFSYGRAGCDHTEKRWYDLGIYNVKDKSVKPLYPPIAKEDEASEFIKPAPIWIVNSAVSAESDG